MLDFMALDKVGLSGGSKLNSRLNSAETGRRVRHLEETTENTSRHSVLSPHSIFCARARNSSQCGSHGNLVKSFRNSYFCRTYASSLQEMENGAHYPGSYLTRLAYNPLPHTHTTSDLVDRSGLAILSPACKYRLRECSH